VSHLRDFRWRISHVHLLNFYPFYSTPFVFIKNMWMSFFRPFLWLRKLHPSPRKGLFFANCWQLLLNIGFWAILEDYSRKTAFFGHVSDRQLTATLRETFARIHNKAVTMWSKYFDNRFFPTFLLAHIRWMFFGTPHFHLNIAWKNNKSARHHKH
jgi:hypothetical protein